VFDDYTPRLTCASSFVLSLFSFLPQLLIPFSYVSLTAIIAIAIAADSTEKKIEKKQPHKIYSLIIPFIVVSIFLGKYKSLHHQFAIKVRKKRRRSN